ncbi:ABC transporter permease [Rhodanobacter sp. Col0626]|uniref:ABC transporter permease n=1 Tax=Rhodanobacter sp. Col0626 TaxID=3415679 RepID=UPI003CEAB70A
MTLHPLVAALRKHKAGVILIAMQIALTLAIVCNAVFIIGQRIELVGRATGIDENDLFLVTQQWVGAPSGDDAGSIDKLDAMQREDLAALRALPDVQSVTAINSLPLLNSSWNGAIDVKPDAKKAFGRTTYYFGDEQMFSTLGLHVIAGRAFTAADITHQGFRDQHDPDIVMLTKPLADKLYPKGNAVGKVVYLNGGGKPITVIGVVERMQVPGLFNDEDTAFNSTLEPIRLNANFARYAIRAKPGRLEAAMHAVTPALYSVNPMRVIDDDSVKSFATIRHDAYEADRGMAILMGVVALILLCVTAAGIVGLTSFWVGQRHRQIGVRRALGARKIDILHYFQIENLMIAGAGVVLGIVMAIGLNMWLMTQYEMARIPALYVIAGVLVMLVLGQAAVFVPARRASNVPPVVATRAV